MPQLTKPKKVRLVKQWKAKLSQIQKSLLDAAYGCLDCLDLSTLGGPCGSGCSSNGLHIPRTLVSFQCRQGSSGSKVQQGNSFQCSRGALRSG